jgi:Coatomer subunit gamma-1 C-terminal appendage platform
VRHSNWQMLKALRVSLKANVLIAHISLDMALVVLTRHAAATEQLVSALSLQPLEGTNIPVNSSTHTLKMYGKTVSGGRVAAMVRMAYSARSGVTTKVTVRAEEDGVAATIVASVT